MSTIVNPSNSQFTAIGDLTAANVNLDPTRVPVGANGSFLLSNTSNPAGVFWTSGTYIPYSPVVQGSITAGTASYSTQSGAYYILGNIVFVFINITFTSFTGSGAMQIQLPIAPNASMGSMAFTDIIYNGDYVGGDSAILSVIAPDLFATVQVFGPSFPIQDQLCELTATISGTLVYAI